MPRRASSGIKIGHVLAIGGAILGFLVAAALLIRVIAGDLIGGSGDGNGRQLSSANELQVDTFLNNANSLRGNVYRITGKVHQSLKWTPDRGRLISLDATGGGTNALVPVLIPEKFSSTNIDRGAEFTFIVRVDRGGLLVAETIEQG